MTALYFHVARPEDRIAVKPHASPVFHAIQYLLGNQDLVSICSIEVRTVPFY
jgi:pyruvate dehydrogenase complex dehydrogenase (E1) component